MYIFRKMYKLTPLFVFLVFFFISSISISNYGITWDEPDSFFAGVQKIYEWFNAINDNCHSGELLDVFSEEFTRVYWELPSLETQSFNFYNNHPSTTRIFGFIAWFLFKDFLGDIVAMRVAASFVYALMLTVVFAWGRERSLFAGFICVILTCAIPRLFAFSHFLTTDIFLVTFWVFTAYAFWRAINTKKIIWYLIGWILFGFAVNVKFTAFLIPAPVFLFIIIGNRDQIRKFIYSLPICILPVYLLNPTWWHSPINTFLQDYFFLSLFRTSSFNISVFYCGENFIKAPWHYPLVQTLITVPSFILIFFLASMYLLLKEKRKNGLFIFLLLNIGVMLGVSSLPFGPKYDGVRQFIPVFPFIAMVASESASEIFFSFFNIIKKMISNSVAIFSSVLLVLLMIGYLTYQVFIYHPFQLSYYNEFVGGLTGADKFGMEATYWMEAVTPDFIREINDEIPENGFLRLFPFVGNSILKYYKDAGILRNDIQINQPQNKYSHMILVNRKSIGSKGSFIYLSQHYRLSKLIKLKGVWLAALFSPKKVTGAD